MPSIIDDFEAIRRRQRELFEDKPSEPEIDPSLPYFGDCKYDYCHRCDNGGWVLNDRQPPPQFDECPECYNPWDHPCP